MKHDLPWIILHGAALALINICAILAGFGVYWLVRPSNQVALQAPVAAVLTVLAFTGWWLALRRMRPQVLLPVHLTPLIWVFLAALLIVPVIFYPLHYLSQGYIARFSNVLAIWAFQLPVNLAALWVAARFGSLKTI